MAVGRGFQNLKKRPRFWKVRKVWNSWNSWKVWKFAKKCENVKFVKFVKICEISSKKVPETLLIKGWLTSEFKKKSLFFTFEPKNPVTLSPKFRGRPSFWVKFFAVATFLDPLFSLFLKISQLFTNFCISRKHTFSQNFTLFALFTKFRKTDPPQIWQLSGFFEKVCVQIEIGVRLLWNFDWTRSRTTSVGWLHSQGYWNVLLLFRSFGSEGRPARMWRRSKSRNLVPSAKRCQVAMTGVGHNPMIACRVSPCAWQLVPANLLIHLHSTTNLRSAASSPDAHLTGPSQHEVPAPEGVPPAPCTSSPHLPPSACPSAKLRNDRNAHFFLTWAVSYVGGRAQKLKNIFTHTRNTNANILHRLKLN